MGTEQRPTSPNEWLYKDIDENKRLFVRVVTLPDEVALWAECTNEQREQWEQEHPEPEDEISE